jgi:CRP-like cAMP-binding protein
MQALCLQRMQDTDPRHVLNLPKGTPVATPPVPRASNRLLAALPTQTYGRLLPHLEAAPLRVGDVLSEAGAQTRFVYFPTEGVVCEQATLAGGRSVSVGTTGNEGVAGLSLFLQGSWSRRAVCHVPGAALRMAAAAFADEAGRPGPFQSLLLRYTGVVLLAAGQAGACGGFHTVRQRCARGLLMTRDRMASDRFPLGQAVLAKMLGVRRLGVSEAVARFRAAGLIQYSRGSLTVLDRAGLEAEACECYRLVRDAFDRLLG